MGPPSLRFGIGIIYFWFGTLKLLGVSPAEQLVLRTTYWIPIPHFYDVLGVWETAVGVCFLVPPLLPIGIILLFLHLPGTLLPFLLEPHQVFSVFPYALTFEGQYIVKNVALAAAGLVVGGAIRHRELGFSRFLPDEFNSLLHLARWSNASAGEVVVQEGEIPDRVWLIHSGCVSAFSGDKEIAQCGPGQFLGEMSFVTGAAANASLRTKEDTRLMYWERQALDELFASNAKLQHAFMAGVNRDLVEKLRGPAPEPRA